jgi:hypothetical protein
MNKSLQRFFLASLICFVQNSPKKINNQLTNGGNITISGTLDTQGTTNIIGTILCLSNTLIKDLSATNVNCYFNTNPVSSSDSPSINFGSGNTTNTIILKGLLEQNNLTSFVVLDELGQLFQKKIQIENEEVKTAPQNIDNIDKLYLQTIINYTDPALTILPKDTNNLIINTMNTASITLAGKTIYLNCNQISTSHDTIYFPVPVINTDNNITTNAVYLEQNLTLQHLEMPSLYTMTFFGDMAMNTKNIRILGLTTIDGNTINITSNDPSILAQTNNITLYGIPTIADNGLIDGILGLNSNQELCQIDTDIPLLFEEISSPDGETLTIERLYNYTDTAIFQNDVSDGITIAGETIYINGEIKTADNNPITFTSEVFFITTP